MTPFHAYTPLPTLRHTLVCVHQPTECLPRRGRRSVYFEAQRCQSFGAAIAIHRKSGTRIYTCWYRGTAAAMCGGRSRTEVWMRGVR